MLYMNLNNNLLLEQTPQAYHGRVMSLMSMNMGLTPLGAILGGALADALGAQAGLTVMASMCLGLATLMFVFVPAVKPMT
jgi:hypothetical protein